MTYQEIKSALAMLDNPADKLEMLMDIGARMDPVPQDAQCFDIAGCASSAEICVGQDNKLYGRAGSAIVRGIIAVLIAMVDGRSAQQIRQMDIETEFQGLNLNLGAGRLSGLNSMIRFLKNL